MRSVLAVLLLGCGPGEEAPDETSGTTEPTVDPELTLPDLEGIDLEQAFRDAMTLALDTTTLAPWKAHVSTLEVRHEGCPDFWLGGFADEGIGPEDGGLSWLDDCATAGGLTYDGWTWWETDIAVVGDATTEEGRTVEGARTLIGDALVGDVDGVRFELDGEASDSLYQVTAYGYERWVYSSTVEGTVTGRDAFEGSLTPGGWRTDLYVYMTGGDVDLLELRGNVYLFEPVIGGRFDSLEADLELQGPLGAGPDDCQLEPKGWIGLRDAEANWYDLVFLPRSEDDIVGEDFPNDPLSQCDGCGTLYVRGEEQGEVCVDLSFVFQGELELPTAEDYILTLHDLP